MTVFPNAAWHQSLGWLDSDPAITSLCILLEREERSGKTIYPPRSQRLAALDLTPPEHVRVVILGQDPYHGPGQAHGLAFSVPSGVKVPPSLVNIYKELDNDLGIARADHGDLTHWAQQGVLLLNNALTVEAGKAGSHQKYGWEPFTDAVIAAVAQQDRPSVFMLWGSHAQKKAARIPALVAGPHLVLQAPHPSPLSAYTGFFGCRHFSQANAFLERHGRGSIDWRLPKKNPAQAGLFD
ncbi:uracil-DNA glycosylase [Novosphingobium sp. AAP83]|uniref:uracil-DNA glycosylase n=1 Tax=Novosphingobium sp. AAP83 TaxID=1523425 RepID=UPI0006B8D32E|nr:uracil-DNA glycosylase [Novosphingobium sp. AAP83]KPF93979.1 uracil-DNA glycosylase [Novosphingobium sp. AAP83]